MPIQTFNGFPRPIPDSGVTGQIKSIQNGVVTSSFGAASTSFTQAISTVDVSKSIVIANVGAVNGSGAANLSFFSAEITSPTQITFTRFTSSTENPTIAWQVIEFSAIKSLQTGSFTSVSATSNTPVAISAVNTTRSMIFFSFNSGNNSTTTSMFPTFASLAFTSSTSMNFLQINGGGAKNVRWYVVELY